VFLKLFLDFSDSDTWR